MDERHMVYAHRGFIGVQRSQLGCGVICGCDHAVGCLQLAVLRNPLVATDEQDASDQ